MPKMGIRGTATGDSNCATSKCRRKMFSGRWAKGCRVALTVLDFGRTTFGACCTGAAKTCLRLAVEHANTRKQFNKTLGNFHLVKKKIARIAADAYAMEAMTTITASFIDRGLEDYMLETAMLKVFHDRAALGGDQRGISDSRRLGLFRRSSAGANVARRADQSDRRREQRSADLVYRAGRECAGPGWSSRKSTTRC